MRFQYAFLSLMLLSACSSHKDVSRQPVLLDSATKGFLLNRPAVDSSSMLSGDFAGNPSTMAFIDKMVQKHGFDRQQLQNMFSHAQRLDAVLRLMDRQAPTGTGSVGPNGAWLRYRNKFITPDNVQRGAEFWQQYQQPLQRASRQYGVPAEIIVGIIGVETRWGRIMGKTRVIDALSTLAFDYPRRASFFADELETFLLMCRSEHVEPLSLRGSYAGAMGYGQFMPSSFRSYAVDFNNDGHVNLWDPVDAIGSVANYFRAHGWRRGEGIAVPARGQEAGLESGYQTHYRVSSLKGAGLSPQLPIDDQQQVSLLRLDVGSGYQYWFGLPNFYTITRYNHSTHYAMAVWQLGEAVAKARQGMLIFNQ